MRAFIELYRPGRQHRYALRDTSDRRPLLGKMWVCAVWFSIVSENEEHARQFKVGDRIELLLYYSFEPGPLPQGTVVRLGPRELVKVKMDRNGKLVSFMPSDLRIIKPGKGR